MVVQHNLAAVEASRQLSINTDNRAKRSKNLSSGYRINSAADDAANLCISEKMRSQIRGLNRGSQNAQDGISMLQTGDAALSEVHEILQRICELSVQAANDTNTAEERSAIQEEINELKIEINDIGKTTEFNGIKIFKPTEAPDISGSPWDILVYHEDYTDVNGQDAVREGGIIYNGIRYAYANMNLEYDDNDNIKAGTYDVVVEGENGDPVVIKLMFDGNNRIPSGREYELEPDYDGITIDGILHKWTDMTYESGGKFNPNNIHEGTVSFKHANLTITIPTENGMDIDDLITSLEEEGLLSYTLKSNNPVEEPQQVTPSVSITTYPPIETPIEDLIPAHYGSRTGNYKMIANSKGIYLYIPPEEHCGNGEVKLTFKA